MKFPLFIPFVEHLGFELIRFGGGSSVLALDLRQELCNSWNVAHGGLTMTLMDVAMAHAARNPDDMNSPGLVTIEMKTSFMRPGLGRLVAHGKLLHRSTTMAFMECSVVDDKAKLVAHATGTFKFLKALPTDTGLATQVLQVSPQ